MIKMNMIEKELYDALGDDLFRVYRDGHLLTNRYAKDGINLDEITGYYFETTSYLSYPVYHKREVAQFDESKEFVYDSDLSMIMISPVKIESLKDLSRYGFNSLMFYTDYDDPILVQRKKVHSAPVSFDNISIVKVILDNQRELPILPDGNSKGLKQAGHMISNGLEKIEPVEFLNRSAMAARVLQAFGKTLLKD